MKRVASSIQEIHPHLERIVQQLPGDFQNMSQPGLLLYSRFLYWPNGISARKLIGFASSRIGRKLDQRKNWLQALRAALMNIRDDELLLTIPGTTCAPFVSRSAELFGIGRLEVCSSESSADSLEAWVRGLEKNPPEHVTLSPIINNHLSAQQADDSSSQSDDVPMADRLLFSLADCLYVLHARKNSHTATLVRRRNSQPDRSRVATWILADDQLIPRPLRDEFLQAKTSVEWIVLSESTSAENDACSSVQPDGASAVSGDAQAPQQLKVENCFTHCTRAADGPWPDETETDYLDATLVSGDVDRTAFATLCRIVRQKRLLAGSAAIRGQFSVVCFSAVPADELIGRRTFRNHRGRWDYEPYGLCIDRDWLQAMGCRQVTYGSEEDWKALDETQRPFFQKAIGADGLDWSQEQEWRVSGNVDLLEIPADKIAVFVPTEKERLVLQRLTNWPVFVPTNSSRS